MLYEITWDHRRWVKNVAQRHKQPRGRLFELIQKQQGRCAFSDVPLFFDREHCTPTAGGRGCHPLAAALDHTSPGCDTHGHCIVSYALNDLKGHLPHDCFVALKKTNAWRRLMTAWQHQATVGLSDYGAFRALLRPASESV